MASAVTARLAARQHMWWRAEASREGFGPTSFVMSVSGRDRLKAHSRPGTPTPASAEPTADSSRRKSEWEISITR